MLLRQFQDAGINIRAGDQKGDLMRWPEMETVYDQLKASLLMDDKMKATKNPA